MIDSAADICVTGIDACFDWLAQFFDYFNFTPIFIATFTVIVIYRFLLRPLLGGSAGKSDKVSKSRGKSSDSNGGEENV